MRNDPAPSAEAQPPALRRLRRWARLVLVSEAVLPRLLPALLLFGGYAALGLFGVPQALPGWAHLALLTTTILAALALTLRGVWHLRLPGAEAADRRLELDAGLAHAPLRVLSDRAGTGSEALWALHAAAARAQLTRLRPVWPRPTIAAADLFALRALVLLLIAAGLGVAGASAPSRLAAAFTPGFTLPPSGTALQVQAWITPPSYTGMPPLVLKSEGASVNVPEFSVFSATISGLPGGSAAPSLEQGAEHQDFTALDAHAFQLSRDLAASGHLVLRRAGREIAAWDVTLQPDAPPSVAFPEPPGRVLEGNSSETRLPWKVAHRYGVAGLHAELHLAARPDAEPLIVPIPLPGAPKDAHGAQRADLSASPWAGLKVLATLVARDVAGREARSAEADFALPERRFRNKLARAVVAIRRQLSLTPAETGAAAEALDALGEEDEAWADDPSGLLNLAAIAALLRHGRDTSIVPEAQDRLWSLALHLEEGAPDRTERALEAARRALGAELAEKAEPDQDQADDLPHRVEDLAEALRQRLDALSQEARSDPDSQDYNPDAHPRDRRDMQRLTDALREAARQGKRDIARDLLAELDRKLQALKGQRAERSPDDKAQADRRQRGKRQLGVVQDMVQHEGSLLDHAQFRPPAAAPDQPVPTALRAADRRVQLALRRALGVLMEQQGDLTGNVPPNLGEADQAMREGALALAHGDDTAAAMSERRAIAALQQGGRDMRQQMARQFGAQNQDGDQQGDDQAGDSDEDGDDAMASGDGEDGEDGEGNGIGPNSGGIQGRQHAGRGRDPLGRPRGDGVGGSEDDGDVAVPEQMEQARTRELQEELRRRGADRTRRQDELDYIDRLLKQF
jgi:hypothetical protein